MATKQDISFGGPAAVIAPDLVVEQQKWQRQQNLIDALRQRSLEPIDAGRGAISWTQGMAQVLGALAAKRMQGKNDDRLIGINRGYADRMRGQFGMGPVTPPASQAPVTTAAAPVSAPPAAQQPTFDQAFGGDTQQSLSSGAPLPPLAAPAAPTPQQNAAPPSQAPVAPATAGTYPMSLSGNPQQDFNDWAMDPNHYAEKMIDSHAPTDFTRQLVQSGIDPNSGYGRRMMQDQVFKQNYIAPVNSRGGSYTTDPMTGKTTYHPNLPEGSEPVYDVAGNVVGVKGIDGALQLISAVEGAKARAKASAEAPFDLVEVTDTNGNKFKVPKSNLTGGGAPGGTTTGGGGLNSFYGRGGGGGGGPAGNMSGLGPGGEAAATETGKTSAAIYNKFQTDATDVPNIQHRLDTMLASAKNLQTGHGAGAISQIKSGVNAATGAQVFDTRDIAKFDEIKKNAAQLADLLSQGGSGSDARLRNAIDALPNANYSPKAFEDVAYAFKGMIAGRQAAAQAAAAYQRQHGANSGADFQNEWNRLNDPEMFEAMQRDHNRPGTWESWLKQIGPARKADVVNKLRQMRSMGVTF